MANQRKKGLRLIAAYIKEQELDSFKHAAKRRRMNVADLLRELIHEGLRREESPAGKSRLNPEAGGCPQERVTVVIEIRAYPWAQASIER